jgi:arylsulfatase A-like enzyme
MWWMLACQPGPALVSEAPARERMRIGANLQITPSSPGGTLGVRVGWGTPGVRVEVWGGQRLGLGPCETGSSPDGLQGACLGIVQPVSLGSGSIGADGTARFDVTVPATFAAGSTLAVQATLEESSPVLTQVATTELRAPAEPAPAPLGSNVLIVLLDDVGTDKLAAYGAPVPALTPTIDSLAAAGVTFDAAYSRPVCVASRAALQTGRYARRTGVGINWREDDPWELGLEQVTLAELVELSPHFQYETSFVGKWHLSSTAATGLDHALRQGWDFYAGSFANLFTVQDGMLSYTDWWKVEGGVEVAETQYATSDTIDDAVARVAAMAEPWMLFVSLNAAHAPMDLPPPELVPVSSASGKGYEVREMLGAADTELARLLASIPGDVRGRTTVFLTADNGTPKFQATEPVGKHRAKGTLFDGSVRVPLIVSGAGVSAPGSRSAALVDLVDLFPTVASLAGVDPDTIRGPVDPTLPNTLDGLDLSPLLADPAAPGPGSAHWPRPYAYSELFGPPGGGPWDEVDRQMLRDARYKLIVDHDFQTGELVQFFEYAPGAADEGPNLLACGMTPEQQAAYDRLSADLVWLTETLVFDALPFGAPSLDTGGAFSEFPLEQDTAAPDCGGP